MITEQEIEFLEHGQVIEKDKVFDDVIEALDYYNSVYNYLYFYDNITLEGSRRGIEFSMSINTNKPYIVGVKIKK